MAHTPAGSGSAPRAEPLRAPPRPAAPPPLAEAVPARSSRGMLGAHQAVGTGEFETFATDEVDELIGTTLSYTYLILKVLGEGGMGRVYEAQHTRIASKRFAIKTLHPEFARRTDVRARFQREAEASAAINHPNVLGVYDVDTLPDGRPYMVSELLEGQELGKYLDEHGRIGVPFAITITRQICDALHAAHSCGVIHRDVKPENVFLTGDLSAPVAKVLDFGISRLEGKDGNTLTRTGMVMGTPSYMAPEQAMGHRVDLRTDMYATGAILYRALTGHLPFDKVDATATLAAVLTADPTPPRTHNPAIPASLELVIQRAMAREADDRYQHMGELDAALAHYDTAHQPPAVGRMRPGLASETNAARLGREALEARPKLVMLGVVAMVGLLFGLMATLAGLIRLFRGGPFSEMTGTEALVIAVGAVCALTTPVVLIVRNVLKTNWENTARVIELSAQLRKPLLVGLSASGLLSLTALLLESTILRNSVGLAWPLWGMAIPLVGMAAATAVMVAEHADPLGSIGRMAGVRTFALGALGAMAIVGVGLLVRNVPTMPSTDEDEDIASVRKRSQKKDRDKKVSTATAKTSAVPHSWSPKTEKLLHDIRKYQRQRNTVAALSSLEKLLKLDAKVMQDKELRRVVQDIAVRASLMGGETAERMNDLLINKVGSAGPDILFEIMVTRGGTAAASSAKRMLRDKSILKKGSSELQIAYALRSAKGCEEKKTLFSRAVAEGDHRALRELTILKMCKGGGCCMGQNEEFKQTVTALKARLKK